MEPPDLSRMWRRLVVEDSGLARHLGHVSRRRRLVCRLRRLGFRLLDVFGESFDPTLLL